MKILITGASGFIGKHLVSYLLEKTDYSLILTSRTIEESPLYLNNSRVKKINSDLSDKGINYFNYFDKPDILIHLVWEGLPNYNESYHITINPSHSLFFIENMVKNGLKKIVITGTCLEYGMQKGCLSEASLCIPTTNYGKGKLQLLNEVIQLRNKYKFDFNWVRLFYMYGDGQSEKSLYTQMKIAIEHKQESFNMSLGEQKRDFLPIEKVCEYLLKIAIQRNYSGIVNCCSGQAITVKEFVQNYFKLHNYKINLNLGYYNYPDYEPLNFWGDNTIISSIIYL